MEVIVTNPMKVKRTLIIIFAIAGMMPPLIFRLINWHDGNLLSSWIDFLPVVLNSMTTTVIVSFGVMQVLFWLQANYPWQKNSLKRFFWELVLTPLTACLLISLLTLISHWIIPKDNLEAALFNNLIIAIILNFVLVAITEGIFFFRQWKQSAVEAESYKKEHILAQFESLKNQVNPHFLFNSLNTLSSLIDQDKEISKTFLDNLSTVYRYVLQHKDEELVLLRTEYNFIKTYAQLLKKRHLNRIIFNFNIAEDALSNWIPPMALQLLVENAVKHNIASRKKPLTIEIYTQENIIVVRNNLQRKKNVESTGIGLNNIKKRYQYLSDKNIEIIESLHFFEVRLPIILMTQIPNNESLNNRG